MSGTYWSKRCKYVTAIVIALFNQSAIITNARASTQGNLGIASEGNLTITVTKPLVARISGLSDMAVSWDTTNSDIIWTNDICVFSSAVSGGYTLTASGSAQAGGAFQLSDGTQSLPYNVAWNDGGAGNLSNTGTPLVPGVPTNILHSAATDNASCQGASGGATARLIVNIPEATVRSAHAGTYTESLTLVVAPN